MKVLAGLLGICTVFLPGAVPFLGAWRLLKQRLRLGVNDGLILCAALLASAPNLFQGDLEAFFFGILQFLTLWVVYRTFATLRFSLEGARLSPFSYGVLIGLTALALFSYIQVNGGVARASGFAPHSNLFAHSLFVVSSLTALAAPAHLQLLILGMAGLSILLSGSYAALAAWALFTLTLIITTGLRAKAKLYLIQLFLIASLLSLVALTGNWGRLGGLFGVYELPERNLLHGSELLAASWWYLDGVNLELGRANLGGASITAFRLTKTSPEPWKRLQQGVQLEPAQAYTLSVWVKQTDEERPGFQGWGIPANSDLPFSLEAVLVDQAVEVNLHGPGTIVTTGTLQETEWTRIWVTFRYDGTFPIASWMVGPAPDQRTSLGTAATFAGIQLEHGLEVSDYEPTYWLGSSEARGSRTARLPYFQVAWEGFLERPFIGWGAGAYNVYYAHHLPQGGSPGDLPPHSHNLFLQVAFEKGIMGLLGLFLLISMMIRTLLKTRDLRLTSMVLLLLGMNLVDYTLFYSGIIYPLMAGFGWHATTPQVQDSG